MKPFNNLVTIAAAGTGKTTQLIKATEKLNNKKILITTYTNENTNQIKTFLYAKYGYLPGNITILSWYSFLLREGVRPFQNSLGFERRINKSIRHVNKCLGYFYFDSPDREMHVKGIDSLSIHFYVKRINKMIGRLVKKNPDTVFLAFADHGHINVKYLDICEHEDLYSLLRLPLSFEKRTPTFFVKEGKNEEFKTLFNKYFGQHFDLMSKEEVLEGRMFGEGIINFKAVQFIGDFVATSKDQYCLYASKEMKYMDFFKGHHAGNTKEEMLIDVTAYNV